LNRRRFSGQLTLIQQKLEKENQHILDQIKKKNQQYIIQRKLLLFDETEQNILDKFDEEHKLAMRELKEKQQNILQQIEKEHERILRTKEQNLLKFHQIKEEKQQLEEKQESFSREKEQELIKLYKIDEIYQERLFQRAIRQRKEKRLFISRQLELNQQSEQVKQESMISNEQKEPNIPCKKEQQLLILYQIDEEYLNLLFQRALKQREQKRLYISNQLAEENKFIIQRREEVLKHNTRISEHDLLKMHQIEKENQQSLLKRVLFQRFERQKRLEIQLEEERQYNLQKNKNQSKQVAYQIEYLFKRRKHQ